MHFRDELNAVVDGDRAAIAPLRCECGAALRVHLVSAGRKGYIHIKCVMCKDKSVHGQVSKDVVSKWGVPEDGELIFETNPSSPEMGLLDAKWADH